MFYFNLYIQSLYIFSNYKCPEAHFYLNRLINGRCCVDLEYYSIGHEIYFYLIISVNGCSILACQVVVLSTIYIIYKLTILRIKLQWTDSSITQKRNRTSALPVVTICIIFYCQTFGLYTGPFGNTKYIAIVHQTNRL